MVTIQQGLREDGFEVSMVKLCRWFGVARRSVYYRPTKATPKVNPALAEPSNDETEHFKPLLHKLLRQTSIQSIRTVLVRKG